MKILLCLCFSFFFTCLHSQKIEVGKNRAIKTIKKAIQLANPGDTVLVYKGVYREGNIVIDKKIILQGIGFPILDGQKKYEVVSIKANSVTIAGFKVINSGYASLNDPCGIKIYNKTGVTIKTCKLSETKSQDIGTGFTLNLCLILLFGGTSQRVIFDTDFILCFLMMIRTSPMCLKIMGQEWQSCLPKM
jgi:hypothetical protein